MIVIWSYDVLWISNFNTDFLHLVFTQVNDFIQKYKFCSMNEICKREPNQNIHLYWTKSSNKKWEISLTFFQYHGIAFMITVAL
jgi:hypothetical protein